MRKLTLLLVPLMLLACKGPNDDANDAMNVDENLTIPANDAPVVVDTPQDPCGRHVVLGTGPDGHETYYTKNPDGTLSEGVIQGIYDKGACRKLISSDNDTKTLPAVHSQGSFTDLTG